MVSEKKKSKIMPLVFLLIAGSLWTAQYGMACEGKI